MQNVGAPSNEWHIWGACYKQSFTHIYPQFHATKPVAPVLHTTSICI